MAMSFDKVVPTNKPKINAYIDPEVNDAIEKEARKEVRSKSQMIALLLKQALEARGYQFSEEEE